MDRLHVNALSIFLQMFLAEVPSAVKEFEAEKKKNLALRRANNKTRITEPATGLLNKVGFKSKAEKLFQSVSEANIQDPPKLVSLVLIAFDIDYFKLVNDTFGHDVGDGVLLAVAKQARNVFKRPDDLITIKHRDLELSPKKQQRNFPRELVGRDGGEEFVIAFRCNEDKAYEVGVLLAERLRRKIERNCKIWAGKSERNIVVGDLSIGYACDNTTKPERVVTASLGISVCTPGIEHKDNSHEAIANWKKYADVAMYAAKRAGRNCAFIYNAGEAIPAEYTTPVPLWLISPENGIPPAPDNQGRPPKLSRA